MSTTISVRSGSVSKARKQIWFDRGAEALRRITGDPEATYGCPLCLEWVGNIDDLSFEHAPPASLGGKAIALTCKACNSLAGHTVDAEMRQFENIVDFGRQTLRKPLKVTFGTGGSTMAALLTTEDGGVQVGGLPANTNPVAHRAVVAHLKALAEAGTWEGQWMTVTWKGRWTPQGVRAGWFRSAYLVAFAAFGYRYILRPQINIVREQIRRPDIELAPRAVMFDASLDPGSRQLALIERPRTLESVYVTIGRFAVLLPGLSNDRDVYVQIASRKRWPPRGSFSGTGYPWPSGPQHRCDR